MKHPPKQSIPKGSLSPFHWNHAGAFSGKFVILSFLLILSMSISSFAGSWSTKTSIQGASCALFPQFSSDGETVVYLDNLAVYTKDEYSLDVVVLEGDDFGDKTVLGSNGIQNNFPYVETHPAISGNGNTIVYLGNDPVNNENRLFYATKNASGVWSNAQVIDSIPTGWLDGRLSLDYSGNTLAYICGTGGFFGGTSTLFLAERVGGVWQAPKQISNHEGDYAGAAGNPVLSDNGTTLLWRQANHQFEILVSQKIAGTWQSPQVLTSSEEDENYPYLSRDGSTIFYWKIYLDGNVYRNKELYAIKKEGGSWQSPKLISKTPVLITTYDSRVAASESGNRVVYPAYIKEGDTITTSYLLASEYQNGSWTTPSQISSADFGYQLYPTMSADGKDLIFSEGEQLYHMHNSTAAEENEDPGKIDPPLGNFYAWQNKEQISSGKTWTIRFNAPLSQSTVNSQNIYVLDWQNNVIPVTIQYHSSGNKVVVTPLNPYDSKEWYYLYITDGVKSLVGNTMTQGIRMKFVIE